MSYYISKFFMLIIFAVLTFYLSGCVGLTKAVSESENDNASQRLAYEYWKIKSVVSAARQESGEISICVELVDDDTYKNEESKFRTITVPFDNLTANIDEGVDFESSFADGTYYPMQMTKKDCDIIGYLNLFSTSALTIERLDIQENYRNQAYDLLNTFNIDQLHFDKLYEVAFVYFEEDTAKATDRNEVINIRIRAQDDMVRRPNDVLLVYWPTQIDQQGVKPISIAGVNRGAPDQKSKNAKDSKTKTIIRDFLYFPALVAMILIATGAWVPILIAIL